MRSEKLIQEHFLWTIEGPDSSYSCLEIHMVWKVAKEARIDPPIQTETLRSGGAMTLMVIEVGAILFSSLVMRSAMPAYIVVPPESTVLA